MGNAGGAGGVAPVDERATRAIANIFDVAIETEMLLRLAFGQRWRQTEGLLRAVARLLCLAIGIPDQTTLSRRSAAMPLAAELDRVKGPVHVLIDSTGLKVYGAGEWHRDKHDGRDRHLRTIVQRGAARLAARHRLWAPVLGRDRNVWLQGADRPTSARP